MWASSQLKKVNPCMDLTEVPTFKNYTVCFAAPCNIDELFITLFHIDEQSTNTVNLRMHRLTLSAFYCLLNVV